MRKLSLAFKIIISVAILFFLFHNANLSQGIRHLTQLHYSFLLLSVVFIVIGQFIRAQRLSGMLFGGKGANRFWQVLRIQMVSFLPGVVSPAKVGEVSKVYMLQSELDVPATRGLICFIAERLFDLLLLTPLAAVGFYVFSRNGLLLNLRPGWVHLLGLGVVATAGALVMGVVWMRKKGVSFKEFWQTAGPEGLIGAAVLTLVYWGVVFLEVWCFCKAGGFDARVWHMALVVPPALLSSMIPISFSGFGVREAAMVILFQRSPIGTSYEQAFLVSLMYDVIGLGVPAMMGILFWHKGKNRGPA